VRHVPNALSVLRIALAPVLLALAWVGAGDAFVGCLVVVLASDAIDGRLARRWEQASELGARLDSWGDFCTYTALPVCAWWLRPDVARAEAAAFATIVAGYTLPVAIGWLRFRRLTSYHTWSAKVAAYVAGGAAVVVFAGGPTAPLRLAAAVVALAAVDDVLVTAVLPRWRADVPSAAHALALRRAEATRRTITAPATAASPSPTRTEAGA
jgi:CDP-diacylglycerol--glycerol-3-phosphate 3-phosphatidyltransferase